jgi:hypothetical protein
MTGWGALVRPALPRQREKKAAARGGLFGDLMVDLRCRDALQSFRAPAMGREAKARESQGHHRPSGRLRRRSRSQFHAVQRANGGDPGSVALQVFPGIRHVQFAKNESVSFASVAVKVRLFVNQPVRPPSTAPSPIKGERLDLD